MSSQDRDMEVASSYLPDLNEKSNLGDWEGGHKAGEG